MRFGVSALLLLTATHTVHAIPAPPRRGAASTVPPAPANLPVRHKGLKPEGSTLRAFLAGPDAEAHAHWRVYYDTASGHPYYFDVLTSESQWENPFGQGLPVQEDAYDYESWRIYDTVHFEGLFDDLSALAARRELPPTGLNSEAVAQIAALAAMDFDVAQAKLEASLFHAELQAYGGGGLPARESWLKPDAERDEVVGVAVPPAEVDADTRVKLAGAWNDLACVCRAKWTLCAAQHACAAPRRNMWYARGEWEVMFDCWRKSLFWNPEQTSALLNMASVLGAWQAHGTRRMALHPRFRSQHGWASSTTPTW